MDNGYAVGYLDDGEFVEVGRFNNLDAVANSDLEIRHADSETRVVLGDDGFDFDNSDVEGILVVENSGTDEPPTPDAGDVSRFYDSTTDSYKAKFDNGDVVTIAEK